MKRQTLRTAGLTACLAALATAVFAQAPAAATPPVKLDTGDTAWMLTSTAFVFLMTPGLALFYAGMVRSKNVLSVLMQSFLAAGLVSILWVLVGYSLAFGPDHHGIIGGLDWVGLKGVSMYTADADYAPTIPHMLYMMYQMTFAIITPALISGAIVERMKFSSYFLFMALWSLVVYCPIAHMVWGHNGYLGTTVGALDFAGGTVVHISSGISALTLAIILGKRKGNAEEMRPHNLPMTLIGTALLWFGWFGFNAGSGVSSSPLAVSAFTATHVATSAAAMTWMMIEWAIYKKPSALGFASGAVAGLVAITPAAGFVRPMPALFIGIVVSFVCFFAIKLKSRFGYDDALDVFGVHACGGIWGALATGLFATKAVNAAGNDGLFNGNPAQLGHQALAVAITIVVAVVGTVLIAGVVGLVTGGIRASADDEENGLDVTEHGEVGYHGDGSGTPALVGID